MADVSASSLAEEMKARVVVEEGPDATAAMVEVAGVLQVVEGMEEEVWEREEAAVVAAARSSRCCQ